MDIDPDLPILTISQAAELAQMHPQTLRQYDRLGLVSPNRTSGLSRRYTLRNVAQLAEVTRLTSEGVTLNAIKRILELENKNAELARRVLELEALLTNEIEKRPGTRIFAAGDSGTVSVAMGKRPSRATSVVLWRQR
jgi:MerR family transcriptional regulator/heat shock protein HspR